MTFISKELKKLCKDNINFIYFNLKKYIKYIWTVGKIYIIWIFLYYVSSHLYTYYCVPFTIVGFITAPMLVNAPHCVALRWCITHGAEVITSMWLILGTWLVSLLITKPEN